MANNHSINQYWLILITTIVILTIPWLFHASSMVQVESVGTFRMPGEKAAWLQLSGRFKLQRLSLGILNIAIEHGHL